MNKIIKLSVRNLTEEELFRVSEDSRDFPQIALMMSDESNNESRCHYIYPLRGYFFQIGGLDADGAIIQGNHFFGGAKGLIKKCRSIGMTNDNIKDVFNTEASACILNFIKLFTDMDDSHRQEEGSTYDGYSFRVDPIIGSMGISYKNSVWSKFINHTFEYFNN